MDPPPSVAGEDQPAGEDGSQERLRERRIGGEPPIDDAPDLGLILAPFEPVDHPDAGEVGPVGRRKDLIEPCGLEFGLCRTTGRRSGVIEDRGLDDGDRLVVAIGIDRIEVWDGDLIRLRTLSARLTINA